MTDLTKLGVNIKKKRKELNLSQEALAFDAGIHRTYMGAVERGEKNIAFNNLQKIARALNTNISELTKGI